MPPELRSMIPSPLLPTVRLKTHMTATGETRVQILSGWLLSSELNEEHE